MTTYQLWVSDTTTNVMVTSTTLHVPDQALAILKNWDETQCSQKLCPICQSLPLEVATFRDTDVLLHSSLASLKLDAEAGCPFCLLCFAALESETNHSTFKSKPHEDPSANNVWLHGSGFDTLPSDAVPGKPIIWITVGDRHRERFTLTERRRRSFLQKPCISGSLNLVAKPDTPPAKWFPGRLLSDMSSSLSPEKLEFIESSLRECLKTHDACSSLLGSFSPSRLIQVGQEGRSSRLVSKLDLPDSGIDYTALSYCWGGDHGLRLTQSNLAELQTCIDEKKLNKTCRQALEFARQLDLPYLWIDAICIIQGDSEDWQRESLLMAEIYGKAVITLVTNEGSSSQDGLFETTTASRRFPYVSLRYSNPVDPEADGAVFACIEKTIEAGPTETRVWCLQQRMLSARLVLFGPEQLVGLIAEQSGHCPQTLLHGPNAPLLSYKGLGAKAFDPEIRSLVLTSWYYAVSNYSTRQMSNPLDVFAAISSVARRAEQFRPERYLAGLWSDDLLQGLLWLPKSSRMI